MRALSGLIKRDLLLALRSGGTWAHGLVFFAVFLALCAIALGGETSVIRPLAPALIWLALVLSLLFSFEQLFAGDVEDGSLEQIRLSGLPLTHYVSGKCIVHWLLTVVPLLAALPIAGLFYNLSMATSAGLFFTILIASPALIIYGAFSGACLTGYKGGGVLLVLLTTPLLIPVLMFAIEGVLSYEKAGLGAMEFQALSGLSLIALAIGIPASAAALGATME